MAWEPSLTDEVRDWLHRLRKEDRSTSIQIAQAITMLKEAGPGLGRPLVDSLHNTTSIKNLKELRPGSSGRSEIRILFVFHAGRIIILLAGADKSTNWKGWYDQNIPLAEERYADWQSARKEDT